MMNTNIMCFLACPVLPLCVHALLVCWVFVCVLACVCVCDGDLQIGCLHVSGRVVCD